MATNRINFTERALENLSIPTSGQAVYYDTGSHDGLCVIVTYGGAKTYYAYMKFQGTPKRVKIGRVGQIKLCDARRQAHSLKEMATNGTDPSVQRRENLNDMTLRQFYENIYKPEYSTIYKKQHSVVNDDSVFKHRLNQFHNRKLLSIKSDEIERLHAETCKTHSPYTANRVLSLIKHMYVIAVKKGLMGVHGNPAGGIRKFTEKSRDRFLNGDELKRFWTALAECKNDVFRNYVMISLMTGMRRNNVLTMRWEHVDFTSGLIYVPDSKDGQPLQIPMVNQLRELLLKINQGKKKGWVLPSNKSASGHLEDPKRPWQSLLKAANITDMRIHDLRRTMGSWQAISGASLPVIGKSLGHKSTSATQVYSRLTVDPIRDSMQTATDKMLGFVVESGKN